MIPFCFKFALDETQMMDYQFIIIIDQIQFNENE